MQSPAIPPASPNAPTNVCVECGRTFPREDLIPLNGALVCAECKPIFLQRMSEGIAPAGAAGSIWRLGKKLVTRSETPFPDRCIKCNAPANGFRLKRVLYWQHPAYLLLLLCNILILLIVILIVRKKAVLHIGLCEKHQSQRKQGLIIGWSSFLGGIFLVIGAIVFKSGLIALIGVLLLLVGGIYGAVRARTITPTKIDKQFVWVTGCHPDFLAEFPEWRDLK